jgi:hypothetical protein
MLLHWIDLRQQIYQLFIIYEQEIKVNFYANKIYFYKIKVLYLSWQSLIKKPE